MTLTRHALNFRDTFIVTFIGTLNYGFVEFVGFDVEASGSQHFKARLNVDCVMGRTQKDNNPKPSQRTAPPTVNPELRP